MSTETDATGATALEQTAVAPTTTTDADASPANTPEPTGTTPTTTDADTSPPDATTTTTTDADATLKATPTEYTKVEKNKIGTIDNLKAFLNEKKINTTDWGKDGAKTVDDLLNEIKDDETILLEKGDKLVRVISAVWVKMLYKVEKDILPESLKNKEPFVGNYYLIETCTTTKKLEITPKVTTKVTTTVAKVDGRYETDMMLPNYKGKPLAGKQTAGEQGDTSNRESIRESALNTATREICEELNIILTSEDFTSFMMVEWYPKNAKGGAIKKTQRKSINEYNEKNIENNPTYVGWINKTYIEEGATSPTKNTKELEEYFKKELEEKKNEGRGQDENQEKAATKIQEMVRKKKTAKKKEEKKKKEAEIIKLCEPCSENSIKHDEVDNGKLVTWEWIKEDENNEDSGSQAPEPMPPIENARPSKSYPTLPTLYQIIHLRTKNLANKKWGTKWKDKKLNTEMLTKLANKTKKLMEVYPPPYCTWQDKRSPFCFNVYENPANEKKCPGQIQKKIEEEAAKAKMMAENPEDLAGGKRKKRRTRKRKKKGTRKRKKKRTRKRKRKKRSKN